jgi:hypothetical protein
MCAPFKQKKRRLAKFGCFINLSLVNVPYSISIASLPEN